MSFNENLIELRKKEGLSQEELGYKLNVTRQTVSKWELGQTTPEMDKLTEISKLFNVSVDELIGNSNTILNQNTGIQDSTLGTKNTKNNKLLAIIVGGLLVLAVVLSILAISKSSNDANDTQEERIEQTADGFFGMFSSLFDKFFNLFDKAIDSQESVFNSTSDFNKQFNVSSFNGKFQIYDGSTMGASAKRLLDEVVTNNKTNTRLITVVYNDITTQDTNEIQNIKTSMDDFNNFEISYDYDADGYITTATIKRVITTQEISRFNSSFEIYAGSSMGGSIKVVLDKIITHNKTEERKISVTYNGTETLDENEIRNIKNQLDTFDNFDMIYEYDQEGFIYKAIVKNV